MPNLPQVGISYGQLHNRLLEMKATDVHWKQGKSFHYVDYASDEITKVAKEAYQLYFHENTAHTPVFQSLKVLENEILVMITELLHGDAQTAGSITATDHESIFMVVKAYAAFAKQHSPHIKQPEIILPKTAHIAFEKAASCFGIQTIYAPVNEHYMVDLMAVASLINENTILLVGSAPNYSQGVMDPIDKLSELAQQYHIPLHVDASLGGFILPFKQLLGENVPLFDFSLPGVTSITIDTQKYGYTVQGISITLYRTEQLRRCQYFVYTDWPGGLYASGTVVSNRNGGAIAATWAVFQYLGTEGFKRLVEKTTFITNRFIQALQQLKDIYVLGQPVGPIFSIGSRTISIFALADQLEQREWFIDRQQLPDCLHFMITPVHEHSIDQLLIDLKEAIHYVKLHPESAHQGRAAIYGMVSTIPDKSQIEQYVIDALDLNVPSK